MTSTEREVATPTPSPSDSERSRASTVGLRNAVQDREVLGDLRRAGTVIVFLLVVWPLVAIGDVAHHLLDLPGDLTTLIVLRALPIPWFFFALARVRRRPMISAREFTAYYYVTLYLLVLTLSLEALVTDGFRSLFAESILVVLAGTMIVPRPARAHALPMIGALAIYPVVMLVGVVAYPPMHGQLADRDALFRFGAHCIAFATTTVLVIIGSNRLYQLRRTLAESRSIGRYALRRRIGKGGMGEVWAAWHRGLEREVALKILKLSDETDDLAAARFEREVRLSSGLTHPNTVRVFDSGTTEDGLLYYAMELLDGRSLGELVKNDGPLDPARAVHLITQAARALAEAHDAGIVHRDVKPENLFVTHAGGEGDFIKVLDFGIARVASEGTQQLTQTGAVAGTPSTMSPEVITGGVATPASDVYGLGAVLYFTLTGRPPFKGEVAASTLLAHLNDRPMPPGQRVPNGVPADIDRIVLRALEKAPEARYADGRAFAEALAACSVAGTWKPPAVSDAPKPRAQPPVTEPPPPSESDTRVEVKRRAG
jgi:serine/threonine-protein kinase